MASLSKLLERLERCYTPVSPDPILFYQVEPQQSLVFWYKPTGEDRYQFSLRKSARANKYISSPTNTATSDNH